MLSARDRVRCVRGFVAPFLFSVVFLLLATNSALATPYTIDSPVDFSVGGLDVRFLPVTSIDPGTLGPPQDGTVSNPTSQDWFVVEVAVLGTSSLDLAAVGIANPVSISQGAGVLAGAGVTPTSVDATSPAPGTDDTPLFTFTGFGAGTSDVLVAAYSAGDLPGAGISSFVPAGTVNFMVDNGTTVASTSGTLAGGVAVVPEPGAAVLLGLGLVFLGRIRRGQSN